PFRPPAPGQPEMAARAQARTTQAQRDAPDRRGNHGRGDDPRVGVPRSRPPETDSGSEALRALAAHREYARVLQVELIGRPWSVEQEPNDREATSETVSKWPRGRLVLVQLTTDARSAQLVERAHIPDARPKRVALHFQNLFQVAEIVERPLVDHLRGRDFPDGLVHPFALELCGLERAQPFQVDLALAGET